MSNIIKRDFHGIQIAFEGKEKASLTDLWKAAGSPLNQEPWRWTETEQAKNFIPAVMQKYNLAKNEVMKTTRGKNGGTWGHWQVALSYAQYLSPELHMFVNQCFVERVQEEQNPDLAIERGNERAIRAWKKMGKSDEWISARIRAKIAQKENQKVLSKHGDDDRVFPMCADAMNKVILGQPAQEYKSSLNLPKGAQTRDYVSAIELAMFELTSMVSTKRIVESNVRGNKPCADVHSTLAQRIQQAVTMRGI